jgi:Protein of unknown function (DUF3662)/FHA domain
VFKKIERQLEKAVEGTFGRAFKASVQPVELAHKLAKEMGDHKTVSVSRVYVPNVYEVYLSPTDFGHFKSFEDALVRELGTYLTAHAQREGWTLVGPPCIELYSDDGLQLGEFGIATRTEAPATAAAVANPVPLATGSALTPPAPPAGFAETIVAPAPLAPAGAPIAQRAATCAVLVVGGQPHRLDTASTMIGRSRRCDVVLPDPNTSRQHAEVRREGDAYVIIDLDSTNGVLVNRRAVKRAVLQDGDRIELGATELRFERRPC